MKLIKNSLYIVSYILRYIMPIVLFSGVVPYYHGELGEGLTGAGVIAACLILLLIYRRVKRTIRDKMTGVARELLLSVFPITAWILARTGINGIQIFINNLVDYWWVAFVFIILGLALKIVATAIKE